MTLKPTLSSMEPAREPTAGPMSDAEFAHFQVVAESAACKECNVAFLAKTQWKLQPEEKDNLRAVVRQLAGAEGKLEKRYKLLRGRHQIFTLVADGKVKAGQSLGIQTGIIRTAADLAKHHDTVAMAQLFVYDLGPEVLPGYKGPPLVFDSISSGNALRFVQDGTWAAGDSALTAEGKAETANVEPHLRFSKEGDLDVEWFALRDLEDRTELFAYYGKQAWAAVAEMQMFRMARVNHRRHRYLLALKSQLDARGIPLPSVAVVAAKVKSGPVSFDADSLIFIDQEEGENTQQTRRLRAAEADEKAPLDLSHCPTPPHLSVREGLQPVDGDAAFQKSGCRETARVSLNSFQFDLPRPACQQLALAYHKAQSPLNGTANPSVTPAPPAASFDVTAPIEVKEIRSLHHPARYLSPPDHPAYCVTASRRIKSGTRLGLYSGKYGAVDENSKPSDSAYIFSITAEQLAYSGPDIQIDSERKGNVLRFINDCYGREGRESTVNVSAAVEWMKEPEGPTVLPVVNLSTRRWARWHVPRLPQSCRAETCPSMKSSFWTTAKKITGRRCDCN